MILSTIYCEQVLDCNKHCLAISSQNVVGGQRRRKAPSGAQEMKWSQRWQSAKSPSEGQSLTEWIWWQFPVWVLVLGTTADKIKILWSFKKSTFFSLHLLICIVNFNLTSMKIVIQPWNPEHKNILQTQNIYWIVKEMNECEKIQGNYKKDKQTF